MKERPWIWIILANIVIITGLILLVIIAVHHRESEVPIVHGP